MRAILASLLLAGACASSGNRVGGDARPASLLIVHNERTEDATIYVMHDGYRGRRLGGVNGFMTATFVLTEDDVPLATDVQFLAASFGHSGRPVLSDPVIVQRGATYDWKLGSARGHDAMTASYRAVR